MDLETQGLTSGGRGSGKCITGWAVKEAVFSFDRFTGIDPLLGPEMKSTGEAIGTGETFGEAYLKAQTAAGTFLPDKGRVFVSVNRNDRVTILPTVKALAEMGFEILATEGTAEFLFHEGIFAHVIQKHTDRHPNVTDYLAGNMIDFLINTPTGRFAYQGDNRIRVEAVRHRIPYTTTTSAAEAAVKGIEYGRSGKINIKPLPSVGWWDT